MGDSMRFFKLVNVSNKNILKRLWQARGQTAKNQLRLLTKSVKLQLSLDKKDQQQQ